MDPITDRRKYNENSSSYSSQLFMCSFSHRIKSVNKKTEQAKLNQAILNQVTCFNIQSFSFQ